MSPADPDARRRRPNRRDFILGGTLAAAAVTAQAMRPRTAIDLLGTSRLDDVIPNSIGPYRFLSSSGLVVPPEDDLSNAIYAQLLTRTYVAEGLPRIMLLVAQSPAQDGVLQMHRPEYCYPAGGYRLSRRRQSVPMIAEQPVPVTTFTASSPDRTEQLLYWTRVGNDLPTTWAAQRWTVARDNMLGYIPDGVLVRISTISPETGALRFVMDFARQMVAAVEPRNRQILIGSIRNA